MAIHDIGEVIAIRRYGIRSGQTVSEITVLIGKPVPFPDSNDFFTPYQITGIGREKIIYAGGIDAVQSLQLAMKMIGYDLVAINKSLKEKLIWEGDEGGDLGFPT